MRKKSYFSIYLSCLLLLSFFVHIWGAHANGAGPLLLTHHADGHLALENALQHIDQHHGNHPADHAEEPASHQHQELVHSDFYLKAPLAEFQTQLAQSLAGLFEPRWFQLAVLPIHVNRSSPPLPPSSLPLQVREHVLTTVILLI